MTEVIGAAAVALVAWFAAGTIWNVRLGSALMRWMQGGLSALGSRTTVRWLGSSAVQLDLKDVKAPLTSATLVVFMEPRDLPWWPLSHARGRRDTLIVRGNLRRAAEVELEALEPGSWSAREALPRVPSQWASHQAGLRIHYENDAALKLAEALLARAQRAGLVVRRLAVRASEPHFQLHIALPDRGTQARELFEAIHTLAVRVAGTAGAPGAAA
jgi:hypothetical protein